MGSRVRSRVDAQTRFGEVTVEGLEAQAEGRITDELYDEYLDGADAYLANLGEMEDAYETNAEGLAINVIENPAPLAAVAGGAVVMGVSGALTAAALAYVHSKSDAEIAEWRASTQAQKVRR